MKKPYRIVSGASTPNRRELAGWLAKDGQLLIPLVELLENGRAGHRRGDRRDGPGDHRGRPADAPPTFNYRRDTLDLPSC